MKVFKFFVCIFLVASFLSLSSNISIAEENKWTRLVNTSGRVLQQVQQMPDEGIPADLLRSCEGIAIFPTTISAGLGIGGKYGQGIIMVRDKRSHKWSPPAIFTIAGGSIGWQIGGQATDIVLLIMSRRSINAILHGKIKLGADAAVSAGPVGRDAQAATDTQLGGILSYSRSKGLFAGIKLEGDVITEHWDGNEELYGKKLSAEDILVDKDAQMPACADDVLAVLKKYPYKK